ncbi:MAG: glycosyl hydrolase, partial [archaeon]|nr:glycosyl hydrolase [archaeon]
TNYEEGILVGYRHFDTNQISPQFPFGFGLSYTSFDYGNFQSMPEEITKDQSINISLDVTNTGKMTGKEIIQIYVRDIESSVLRPDKELKNFNKIELKPNETKTVEFSLLPEDFMFYDEKSHNWVLEEGEFEVLIGKSSKDIVKKYSINIK